MTAAAPKPCALVTRPQRAAEPYVRPAWAWTPQPCVMCGSVGTPEICDSCWRAGGGALPFNTEATE